MSHRIHGTGIFTVYIYRKKNQLNVGKYTSPMDPMGYKQKNKKPTNWSTLTTSQRTPFGSVGLPLPSPNVLPSQLPTPRPEGYGCKALC